MSYTAAIYYSRDAVMSYLIASCRSFLSRGRGYSHTLPIRVCAAQRDRDFEAPDLERGIHFRGIF